MPIAHRDEVRASSSSPRPLRWHLPPIRPFPTRGHQPPKVKGATAVGPPRTSPLFSHPFGAYEAPHAARLGESRAGRHPTGENSRQATLFSSKYLSSKATTCDK